MKNFNWNLFTRKIAVKADVKTIYNAWTVSEEIEKWFLSKAEFFDADKNLIPRHANFQKNNTYAWNWFLFDLTEYGKITEANGIDFLQFTFAGDCLVEIKLSQHNEFTIVALTQKNIPDTDEAKEGIRLGCDTGWSFYLVNLKSVYEGGLDLRNKNEVLTGMLNS